MKRRFSLPPALFQEIHNPKNSQKEQENRRSDEHHSKAGNRLKTPRPTEALATLTLRR